MNKNQKENQMENSEKLAQRQQISEDERKTIIRNATAKAFRKYDDVFRKLSEN